MTDCEGLFNDRLWGVCSMTDWRRLFNDRLWGVCSMTDCGGFV